MQIKTRVKALRNLIIQNNNKAAKTSNASLNLIYRAKIAITVKKAIQVNYLHFIGRLICTFC